MAEDTRDAADASSSDEFLVEEGLELLAAYRVIRCEDTRKAIIKLVASIVSAEERAAERFCGPEPN